MDPLSNVLVISNGNDGQIPFLIRMYESLYHPQKGAFSGDFLFLSDHLSISSQESLKKKNIPYEIVDKELVSHWEKLLQSEKHALGKIAKPLFIRHVIQNFGDRYSCLVYIDPDILLQKPITEVLQLLLVEKRGVFYSAQTNPTMNIPWPKQQLERILKTKHLTKEELNDFGLEINTGFMFGDIESIAGFINRLIDFMVTPPFNQYAKSDEDAEIPNDWHDQDFFRAYARISNNHETFSIIPPQYISHLCNNVYHDFSLVRFSTILKSKRSGEIPHLIHFAGGVWVHFLGLSIYYYGIRGAFVWLERITRRPLRLSRNWIKRNYHQFRRWWIPKYRKIKNSVKRTVNKIKTI